jgi:SAM-dependent methyltransferase
MMLKKIVMTLIRKLGLMQAFDRLYFLWNRKRFAERNKKFLEDHNGISMPPDYMLYEAYRLDYQSYFEDGKDTAHGIVHQFSLFSDISNKSILEWGCGPARIIRHLPSIIPGNHIYGTDYNRETIEWCRNNIAGVEFSVNEINPPLNYPDSKFDLVYGLSVFTHLSTDNHFKWLDEIYRVMKLKGIFILTTQGEIFQDKLTASERKLFSSGSIVERANVKEGHRSYSAFQPQSFMTKMFEQKWEILKFIPGSLQHWGAEQDTWIIQKI